MRYKTGERLEVPNSAGIDPPKTAMPDGAVDCHMHVFDSRFPVVPGRSPDYGTVQDYLLLRRRLGISRCVVVSPSSYGFDNRCLVDALGQFGDTARGVAGVGTDVSESQLAALAASGVRGIRLNFGRVAGTSLADVVTLAARIKPLGWHLQLHLHADGIVAAEQTLAALPVTLVIDHMGSAPQPGGARHPVAGALRRLLDNGRTYVKLSHYHESATIRYSDYDELAKLLVGWAPERMLWGSDWNHANMRKKPDDAKHIDHFASWMPDQKTLETVLVTNPDRLYWGR